MGEERKGRGEHGGERRQKCHERAFPAARRQLFRVEPSGVSARGRERSRPSAMRPLHVRVVRRVEGTVEYVDWRYFATPADKMRNRPADSSAGAARPSSTRPE